jgi:hypothetical protein
MYKKISILFFLALTAQAAISQDSILFKMNYKPMFQYDQILSMKMSMEMSSSGDSTFNNTLPTAGLNKPFIMNLDQRMESKTVTGKLAADKKFPVHTSAISTTTAIKDSARTNRLEMYGYATTESLPVLDSIDANNFNAEAKKALLKTMNNMFTQMEMPDKKMAVGEDYIKTSPMNIPAAGMEMNMIATTKYSLISVTDSTADFTVITNYSMNMDSKNSSIGDFNGFGEGKGEMIYSRKYNYPTKYTSSMKMEITGGKQDSSLKMHIILETGLESVCSIKPL